MPPAWFTWAIDQPATDHDVEVAGGRIRLRSSDPRHKPAIDPSYLSDGADIDPLVRGIQAAREIAGARAMARICKAELAPGPDVVSDEALIADFRARSGTVYHPVGTCRMGRNPTQSVVDARLRAHGVEGLRVADASIFPSLVSGNTNAAVMMVAARAAAMILEDAAGI